MLRILSLLIVKMQVRDGEAGDKNSGCSGEGGRVCGPRQTVVPQPGTQESNPVEPALYECVQEQEAAVEVEGEVDARPREVVLVDRGRTTIR